MQLVEAVQAAEHLQAVLARLGQLGFSSLPEQIRAIHAGTEVIEQQQESQGGHAAALLDRLAEVNTALLRWAQTQYAPAEVAGPVNIPFIGQAGAGKSTTICALLDDTDRLVVWGGARRGTEASHVIIDDKCSVLPEHPNTYTVVRYPPSWWRRMLNEDLYHLEFKNVKGDELLIKVEARVDDWAVRQVVQSLQAVLPPTPNHIPPAITSSSRSHTWTGSMARSSTRKTLQRDIDQCGGYHAVHVKHIRKWTAEQKSWLGFCLVQLEDCPGFETDGGRQWSLHATRLSLSQPTNTVAVLMAKPERFMASGLESILDEVLQAMHVNPELQLVVLVRTYPFMSEEPKKPQQLDKQISELMTTLRGDGHRFNSAEADVWADYKEVKGSASRAPGAQRAKSAEDRKYEHMAQNMMRNAREDCLHMLIGAASRYFDQQIMDAAARCLGCSSSAQFKAEHPSLAERIVVQYFAKWNQDQLHLVRMHLLDRAMHGFLRRMDLITDPQTIFNALDAIQAKRELVHRHRAESDPMTQPAYQAVFSALRPLVQAADGDRKSPTLKPQRTQVISALDGVTEWARDYQALYMELTDTEHVKEVLKQRTSRSNYTGMGRAIRELVCDSHVCAPSLLRMAISAYWNTMFYNAGRTWRPKCFNACMRPLLRAINNLILACSEDMEDVDESMLKTAADHYLRRHLADQPLAPLRRFVRTPQEAPIYTQLLAAMQSYRGEIAHNMPDNFSSAEEFAEAFAPHLAAVYKIMGERHGPEEPGFLSSVDQVVVNVREAVRSLPAVLAGDVQYQVEFSERGPQEDDQAQLNQLAIESDNLTKLIRKLHSALGAGASEFESLAEGYRLTADERDGSDRQQCEQYAEMFERAAGVLTERQELLRPLQQRKRTHESLPVLATLPTVMPPGPSDVSEGAEEAQADEEDGLLDEDKQALARSLMRRIMPLGAMRITPRRCVPAPGVHATAVPTASVEFTSDSDMDCLEDETEEDTDES